MEDKNIKAWENLKISSENTLLYRIARRFHHKYLSKKFLSKPIYTLRFRLIFTAWGYWPLLFLENMGLIDRLTLIGRYLSIDWNVIHAHRPREIAIICKLMCERGKASKDEIFVEAGCWKGGSSAKFSIICKKLGYHLHIYDSFEGVEEMQFDQLEGTTDYSGKFAETQEIVEDNLKFFGESEICSLHKGWFIDTLAAKRINLPVRFVYIDCDLAKGTEEVLKGTLPSLVPNGIIFSQDYHIKPVRKLLHNPDTWKQFGRAMPTINYEYHHLASIHFE